MSEKDPEAVNPDAPQILTDDQIVTERKVPRRSFMTAAGTLLVGGAGILALGRRAAAQDTDSDAKKESDPDSAKRRKEGKESDPDSSKRRKEGKESDPDSSKGYGENKKKRKKENESDPDASKP